MRADTRWSTPFPSLGGKILVTAATLAVTPTQAMAPYYNPRALNPQPLPPGIYAPNHPHPAIACRRVCVQTRNLSRPNERALC